MNLKANSYCNSCSIRKLRK